MFISPLLHRLIEFWSWWIGELVGFLPASIRSVILPGVEHLYLVLNGPEIIVSQGTAETYHEVGRYPLSAATLTSEQAKEIEELAGRTREVVLCLPSDKVLFKTLTLPLAAEENLREVLGFEMDRETPFSLEQVFYDYILSARNPKNNTITLNMVVTPKLFLKDLLGKLNEIGFHLHRATTCLENGGQPQSLNLLPAEFMQRRPDSARYLNFVLGILSLVLLLGAIALPLINKLHVIEVLEARTQLATGKAEVIRRLQEEVKHLGTSSRFLVEKKQATPLVLEIVNEVTRILPDDTWINQLDIKEQEVQIQGQSTSAAALIPSIESSEILQNARFRSPVTKMPGSSTERFHISADVARSP
jgi:general secretion pathway protein L